MADRRAVVGLLVALGRPPRKSTWIYSSIRASSCSRSTACRARRRVTRRPSTRPSPPPSEIGYPCVVKAQVLIGGRGKAGGIKIAKDATEAREHAGASSAWTSSAPRRGPFTVHEVWVEGGSEIDAEYYASIILDRSARRSCWSMLSAHGRHGHRGDRRDPTPTRWSSSTSTRSRASTPSRRAAIVDARRHRRGRRRPGRRDAGQAGRGRTQGGRDPDRGQPADRHLRPARSSRSTPR